VPGNGTQSFARQKLQFGSLEEMDKPTTEKLLKRAYEIWEKNNKPEGRDEEFYHQAEQELRNEDGSSVAHTG
jgi:hypothetical protein